MHGNQNWTEVIAFRLMKFLFLKLLRGNLSYADLITKAISSATDNRLTLSQIYEWMVQNVPYFKDKGDSNSSAGWKVSFISHLNLLSP